VKTVEAVCWPASPQNSSVTEQVGTAEKIVARISKELSSIPTTGQIS
jgi:hypothetical protein